MTAASGLDFWSRVAGRGPDWIARRVPHAGRMCLLGTVLEAGPETLRCSADSHHAPDHPMRVDGVLGTACGVEYAAQAMALHGALLAEAEGRPRPSRGMLLSVRELALHAPRLDQAAGPLEIAVHGAADNVDHCLYRFELHGGGTPLLSGRAVVMLRGPGA